MREAICRWCTKDFDGRATGIKSSLHCSDWCVGAEQAAKLRFIDRRLEDGRISYEEVRGDDDLVRAQRVANAPTSDDLPQSVTEERRIPSEIADPNAWN